MSGSDDLIGLYWTTSGRSRCTSGGSGASSACASGAGCAGRLPGHRALARRPRAPARERRRLASCDRSSTSTGSISSSSSSSATGSSIRATSAGGPPTKARAALRGGGRAAGAPHQGRQHHRHGRAARIVEGFAELCADAAKHTDAKIVYEFMPYDVQVNDVDTALAVVEGADAPNGGLAFDTWHLGKMRLEPEELRRIPLRHLLGRALRPAVRVRGGPPRRGDQPPPAAGRGRVPHCRVRRRVPRARYDGPWGVEVLSEELRNLPIEQIFAARAETTSAQLALSRERSVGV